HLIHTKPPTAYAEDRKRRPSKSKQGAIQPANRRHTMLTENKLLNGLFTLFPSLLLIALYVLSNVTMGVCGAPGGC
ncbi:MAG: hypothetical protein P8169_15980, partial [Chloroflexota bacterium]